MCNQAVAASNELPSCRAAFELHSPPLPTPCSYSECVKVTVLSRFVCFFFCCCNLSAKKFAYQNSKRHLFQRESVCQRPEREGCKGKERRGGVEGSGVQCRGVGSLSRLASYFVGPCKCSQLPMWVSIAFALNEHKLCSSRRIKSSSRANSRGSSRGSSGCSIDCSNAHCKLLQLSLVASAHKIYGVCMYFKF